MNPVYRSFDQGGSDTRGPRRRSIFVLHFAVVMVFLIGSTQGQDSRYLGCFYDFLPIRVLPNLTSCNDVMGFCNNYCSVNVPYCQSSTNMTIEACLGLCADKDFPYAGLQAGTQCFCGGRTARYDLYGQVDSGSLHLCRSNCSGDAAQNCGSDFRMRIFEIGCLPFDAPTNSAISPANESFFEIGQTLHISCREGFFPTGPGNLTCLSTGQWNIPPPSCLPDSCDDAPEPPNGTRPAERPESNATRESSGEYRGGDTLAFVCVDTNVTVNVSCVAGEWQTDGACQEIPTTTELPLTNESTIVNTSMATEIPKVTTSPLSNRTTLRPTDRSAVNQTETMRSTVTEEDVPIATGNTSVTNAFTATPTTTGNSSVADAFTATPTATGNSSVTEADPREAVTSLITEEMEEEIETNTSMTTDTQTFAFSSQAVTHRTRGTIAPTQGEVVTTPTAVSFPRGRYVTMLWLIIIVATALFLFVVVLFVVAMLACRKKAKRDEPINFQGNSQIPRIEDMSQVNHAYESGETDTPNQNGRQTSGAPIRISTMYSQQEIMVENNNGDPLEYAKPVSPAYTTNQSGQVPNEYASPVHHRAGNDEARTGPTYYAHIPEPDYDHARRGSYVEVVTKL